MKEEVFNISGNTLTMQQDAPAAGQISSLQAFPDVKWKQGDRIARNFELLKVLGGGMSRIYAALDHKAKEIVALKTYGDLAQDSKKARSQYLTEAKKWLRLGKHKNIVQARRLLTIEGKPALITEYVSGQNLASVMRHGVLSIPIALEFGIQFCRGMDYAQRKSKIVHKGLTPVNCMIAADRTLKIADFGLTWIFMGDLNEEMKKIKRAREAYAPAESFVRALPYLSPECFNEEEEPGSRSDIYTLGVFLYEMLTGTLPVNGSTPIDFMEQHLMRKPQKPRMQKGEISQELERIILKCLESRERFVSFKELEYALQEEYCKIRGTWYPEAEEGKELEAWELNNRGCSLEEFGHFRSSLEYYDRSLRLNPGAVRTWSNKGIAMAECGDHKEALKCYEKALGIAPEDVVALIHKGHSLAALGRRQQALTYYDMALALDPGETDAWYNKACVIAELGGTEEARELYDRTMEINPEYDRSCYNKANLLQALERHEEALEYLDRAILADPRYALMWMKKGISLAGLGRHGEALSCYQRALELNPEDTGAMLRSGCALIQLDRYAEALHYFDRAIDTSPKEADSWFHKAYALTRLERTPEALLCFDRALAIEPGHVQALLNKGIVLYESGQPGRALHCFDRVLEINRAEPMAWYFKGLILYKSTFFHRIRSSEDAMKCFHNAVDLEPGLAAKVDGILGS